MTNTELARHMLRTDWGIAVFRRVGRDGADYFTAETVAKHPWRHGELVCHPFARCKTEAEARAAANREWRIQKAPRVKAS